MTNLKGKIAAGIATGALLANAMTPMAFAGTEITISGNGAGSNNDAVVEVENDTTVNQTNKANFTNNIDGDSNTGSNDANRNTGGAVEISTGDATVDVTVSNSANQNWAEVDCCANNDVEVKISGNGADSKNTVNYDNAGKEGNDITINQRNYADFDNNVKYLDAKTGNNDANRNTGGDVTIDTGDASVTVAVSNWANANSARVGGGDSEGSLSLWIMDNGADTDNDIVVELENDVDVDQRNKADFDNNVDGDANTGDNDANRNTGGEVEISTGDAEVDVTVDNMANFNWADINCGCTVNDLVAKVAGNGADSDNTINAFLESDQDADQRNDADFDNNVKYLDAKTGNNDANRNGGGGDYDPSIDTGDSDVMVDVSNSANTNGLGGDEPEWPEMSAFGLSLSLNLDFGDLLDYLGL